MNTRDLLKRAGEALDGMGVKALTPTVPTTSSLAVGDFMDRSQVERLVDLTVSQSAWLSAVSMRIRNQRSGEIPRLELNEVVTEGVGENDPASPTTHPDTSQITYNCGKFKSTWYLTHEAIREAAASGEPDFEGKTRAAFAKAMGNDMARVALKGDTSLDSSTRLNRLLRKRDGWLKQIRAAANRATTTYGSAWSVNAYYSLQALLPQEYRDDPDLRWFMPSLLDLAWSEHLSGTSAGVGSALGDAAKIERRRFTPAGIPQLIIPQMPDDQGFATLNGSAVAADAITSPSSNVRAQVDSLFGGYSSTHVGRRVTITCDATGQSETVVVTESGGALYATTSGGLGQSTISTTAGDYTLDVADCASMVLGNPLNLFVVLCDQIRAYKKFEQEAERWRIDVYWEADFGVFQPDALAIQDGIVRPAFTFGS